MMVFDVSAGQLVGLDTSAEVSNVQAEFIHSEEVLIFPVEDNIREHVDIQQNEHRVDLLLDVVEETTFSAESLDIKQQQSVTILEEQHKAESTDLMPQDILKLREQVLEGEWNLEKWEYWFRTSQLSPAVQELAQHGVMQGQINGSSIFQIPREYEGMLSQLQHGLEDALKVQWPNTHFNVEYAEIDSNTPLVMQNARKQKAFNRAVELLHKEPTIKSLVDTFDAELQNIQLKL